MSKVPPGPTPGFLVWRLANKWRVAVDRAVAPLGLTHAQYSLVASLYDLRNSGEPPPSQRRLADHTGMEALYVSKLARALESGGLIERARDPRDPRAVQLALTERGLTVTHQAVGVVQELIQRLLEPLGGLDAPRTRAFTDELTALLGVPLTPPPLTPPPPPLIPPPASAAPAEPATASARTEGDTPT
ncbi:MarR family transcriptional regulator [Streptomyces sp. NPDC048551]|uniref:MarR family winged helix-turn-helix transcriptional regulator n=1 Tax=Streptomyces sp. NPDC048551 TaxID=3155758 RepID=UPI00342F4A8F